MDVSTSTPTSPVTPVGSRPVMWDLVIPTIGRASLVELLRSLQRASGPRPRRIFLVDDRVVAATPLPVTPFDFADLEIEILRGAAIGPAAARNVGWRASDATWIAFLDDDVVVTRSWFDDLYADLGSASTRTGGVQGQVEVPLPGFRSSTDWERNVSGLANAPWITADMAYRRVALVETGGFDERFPRAYREDADLAVRVRQAGWHLTQGRRQIVHPVRHADRWVSIRMQRGNADDALMRRIHGPQWRQLAEVPSGRRSRHLGITAAGTLAGLFFLVGRRRAATVAITGWAVGTAEFAAARIKPGPKTLDEVTTMVVTSAVIPPVATTHWLRGYLRSRRLVDHRGGSSSASSSIDRGDRSIRLPNDVAAASRTRAVLFDRDGTLVIDVPYNGDPEKVMPAPRAFEALRRLRSHGIPTAVISNQSGVARGLINESQVHAVNKRIEDLLGPLGPFIVCLHGPDDACSCRKPKPGMVHDAASRLGVDVADVVVIGDIAADVEAAHAAGARGVLVPTSKTLPHEIDAAPIVARDLEHAVRIAIGEIER